MSNLLEDLGMQWLVNLLEEVRDTNRRLEDKMADLTTAVQELRDAVTGVSDRVNSQIAPLLEALTNAQTALQEERNAAEALRVAEDQEDVEQNASLDSARAAVDAEMANAQAAADSISGEVSRLNEIAKTPEEPTEPPVEPTEPTP